MSSSRGSAFVGSAQMSKEEAMKILNVTEQNSRLEMVERFEHLFKVNGLPQSRSHYLQSKILRAREALEAVFPEQESKVEK